MQAKQQNDHITPEQIGFLKDVANHQMQIVQDNSVYRHVKFSQGDSSIYRFDLHTWPGYLCYCGDMGTYVFQRSHDMFEFFRADNKYGKHPDKLYINLDYWTEKLVAVDGNRSGGKIKEFSEEKFKTVINKYRVRWMREAHEFEALDKAQRRELWEAVDAEVMPYLDSGGDRALHAVHEFSWSSGSGHYRYHFDDFFEHDFTEYSHSIVWCMYALSWAMKQYDDFKASLPKKDAHGREIKCSCCDTTENLHEDFGSGGPYRCNSPDCMVF